MHFWLKTAKKPRGNELNPQKRTLNKKASCSRIEISTVGGFLHGKQKRTKTLSGKYKTKNSGRTQKRSRIALVRTQVWDSRYSISSLCGLRPEVNIRQASPLKRGPPTNRSEDLEKKVKRLEMENELLRNFLQELERK